MIHQLSERSDKLLNALSKRIGRARKTIDEATLEFDVAWEEAKSVFAEHGQVNGTRFIASDGHTLAWQKSTHSPKLDEEKLKELVFSKYSKWKATRIWNKITVTIQQPSIALLEAAVGNGIIDPELVGSCIDTPPPTFSRIRKDWTKHDTELVVIYGIEPDLSTEEEDLDAIRKDLDTGEGTRDQDRELASSPSGSLSGDAASC